MKDPLWRRVRPRGAGHRVRSRRDATHDRVRGPLL